MVTAEKYSKSPSYKSRPPELLKANFETDNWSPGGVKQRTLASDSNSAWTGLALK